VKKSERIVAIAEAVHKTDEAVRQDPDQRRTIRLWCKDDWRDFPVYRVPTDALVLNIDNRRFTAERRLFEEQLGHPLDPENNPNDEISIVSILLDASQRVDGDIVKGTASKAYTGLKTDWNKRKQESPFWIRPDGMVRNGNRRLAMLKRMRSEEGIEGTRFVDAIVLGTDEVDEQELFEMEQREQLTENFKVRYTDINLLITLKEAAEGRGIDWNNPDDIERVAGELQDLVEGDKVYAAIQLRAIKYMDDYLADMGAPGEYHKLIKQIERFRDVGKNMTKIMEDYPEEAADVLRLQFAGITAGVRHGHIRSIGRMFREDRDEYRRMRDQIFRMEDQVGGTTKLENPNLEEMGESTEDDSEASEPRPSVEGYPTERVKSAILNAIDGFEAKNLALGSKLAQVASRLRALDPQLAREAMNGPEAEEVRELLEEITQWAEKVKALL
jgi:hypothetical protein